MSADVGVGTARRLPEDLVRDLCTRLSLIHCVDPFAGKSMTEGVYYSGCTGAAATDISMATRNCASFAQC